MYPNRKAIQDSIVPVGKIRLGMLVAGLKKKKKDRKGGGMRGERDDGHSTHFFFSPTI